MARTNERHLGVKFWVNCPSICTTVWKIFSAAAKTTSPDTPLAHFIKETAIKRIESVGAPWNIPAGATAVDLCPKYAHASGGFRNVGLPWLIEGISGGSVHCLPGPVLRSPRALVLSGRAGMGWEGGRSGSANRDACLAGRPTDKQWQTADTFLRKARPGRHGRRATSSPADCSWLLTQVDAESRKTSTPSAINPRTINRLKHATVWLTWRTAAGHPVTVSPAFILGGLVWAAAKCVPHRLLPPTPARQYSSGVHSKPLNTAFSRSGP